jgi:hypothetical protein
VLRLAAALAVVLPGTLAALVVVEILPRALLSRQGSNG